MSDSLKNIRIINGDECLAIYCDPQANKQHYRRFLGKEASYFMPLLVLNTDEINLNSANTALQHTLRFRVPAIHRHLLDTETDKRAVIIRLFGKVDWNRIITTPVCEGMITLCKG